MLLLLWLLLEVLLPPLEPMGVSTDLKMVNVCVYVDLMAAIDLWG